MKVAYPKIEAGNEWFKDYIKSHLQEILEDLVELTQCSNSPAEVTSWSVGDVFFYSLIEILNDGNTSRFQEKNAVT